MCPWLLPCNILQTYPVTYITVTSPGTETFAIIVLTPAFTHVYYTQVGWLHLLYVPAEDLI